MTGATGGALLALGLLALGVPATATPAGWTDASWLAAPAVDGPGRLGPVTVDRAGGAAVLLRGDAAYGLGSPWFTARRPAGSPWVAGPLPLDAPGGLPPVAALPGGDVLAAGVAAGPAGPVVAAAVREDGRWGPLRTLSGPLPGSALAALVGGVLGPDGTAAVGWREAGRVRAAVIGPEGVSSLAAAGSGAPRLWLSEGGDVLALWERPGAGGRRLVSASRPGGGRWTRPVVVPAPPATDAAPRQASAGLAAGGRAIVVWSAGARGGHRLWWTLAPAPGAAWLTPAPLTQPDPGARVEEVLVSAAGDALVAWSTARATATASRPAGAAGWTPDGPLPAAPGRGRAERSPVRFAAARDGAVTAGWSTGAGIAVTRRQALAGSWPAAEELRLLPGPLAWRLGVGEGGHPAVAWTITGGVARGRTGVAVRDVMPQPGLTSVAAEPGGRGMVLRAGLAAPGRVIAEVYRLGARRPLGAASADLPAGGGEVPLPDAVAARLVPGARYLVRFRSGGADTQAAVASAVVALPR